MTPDTLDEADRRLLATVEEAVPLTAQPWDDLAVRLGLLPADLRARLDRLRGPGGLIRQISGIFHSPAFGYRQVLAALRVDPARLPEAGAVVASHPGVSHAYGRSDNWNLWFTLAVSPASRLGLEATAVRLAGRAGADDLMLLPTRRQYKLRVRFAAPASPTAPAAAHPAPLEAGPLEQAAVRALQRDLPSTPTPFEFLAEAEGLTVEGLLAAGEALRSGGQMRRYAAVLRHRQIGAAANVMVVWRVADAEADAAGACMAESDAVSHCYLRPTREDWPYGLYTMIHGPSREACSRTIEQLAVRCGLADRRCLWTTQEFCKRRVLLFTVDEAAWEASA